MEFRIQDVLKNLLPGLLFCIIIFCVCQLKNSNIFEADTPKIIKDLSTIFFVLFMAIIYITGYLIDAVSSLIERHILYIFLKRPSYYLLNDLKPLNRLAKRQEIIANLCTKGSITVLPVIEQAKARDLFRLANELKDNNPSASLVEKTGEFYNAYIFSRNIMVSVLIGFIVCFYYWLFEGDVIAKQMLLPVGLVLILGFFRWRSKGIYYSRQVFLASYY